MTREHPDNLKKGQYIVITGYKEDEVPKPYQEADLFTGRQPPSKRSFNGWPRRILHIEFPFCIVADDNGIGTIDLREVYVKVVSRRYVEYASQHRRRKRGGAVADMTLIPVRKRKEKPDPDACPRCGTKMRLVKKMKREGWYRHCPQCDLDFGREEV